MLLLRDAQLWLGGSAGAVKVVFLFKLFSPNVDGQIKATLTDCRVVQNTLVLASYALPFPIISPSFLHPTNQPPHLAANLPLPPSPHP